MSLDIMAAGSHIEAEAGKQELLLLGALPRLLATVAEADDPAYDRLYPFAYGEDDADREYRRLAVPEIERARQRDNDTFEAVLARLAGGRTTLTRDEAESCVRAVGAGRITIAARHGLFEQDAFDESVDTPQGAIVAFLGVVQDELVTALFDLAGEA